MPFTALTSIPVPGTNVFGYRRGDRVEEAVVENWNLTDGIEVTSGDLDDESAPRVVARPDEGANRDAWVGYAIANGMDPDDAENAPQEDLEAAGPVESDGPSPSAPERPADSARRADWVAYATAQGADADWADGATKAELQGYQQGDTVALAATEAIQA